MKSVLISEFGNASVLREFDLEIPKIKKDDEVLIKVITAGINPLDIKKRKGELRVFYGKKLPMQIGNDIFGEIVNIANRQSKFKIGDKVFCMIDSGENPAFTGFTSGGGYSEYCITKEYTLASASRIEEQEKLAAVPLAGLTALQGLSKCNYKTKKSILVNGASGGVGLFVVQLARAEGLSVHTTSNSKAMALLKDLGAEETYDYRDESKLYMRNRYDIIFDVACNLNVNEARKILNSGGFYIANVASLTTMIMSMMSVARNVIRSWKTVTFNWVKPNGKMLEAIGEMIERRKVRIIIDKTYLLRNASDAHEYIEKNSIIGKVVLKCT